MPQSPLQAVIACAFSPTIDTPQALAAARQAVQAILDGGSQARLAPLPDTAPERLSRDEIRLLQADLQRLVVPVVNVRDAGVTSAARLPLSIRKQLIPAGGGRFPLLAVRGPLRDVVLEVTYTLLLSTPLDRIRRCVCGTVFYRVGRQAYCSTACKNTHHWASLSPTKIERYRVRQYARAGLGWTRGARPASGGRDTTRTPQRRRTTR